MKRRGSAMLFTVVLIAAMTTVIIATLSATSSSLHSQRTVEDTAIARYVIDGAADRIVAEFAAGTLVLPTTKTITVGSQSCTVTATDNSANIQHTIRVDGSLVIRGRSFAETRIVGARKTPNPSYYALFVNSPFTVVGNLTTGLAGTDGDVYGNGLITLSGLSNTVNGNLETTAATLVAVILTVTGVTAYSVAAVPITPLNPATYSAQASAFLGNNLNGYTFPIVGGNYPILYRAGNLSIRGVFRNKGCIFVNGNVTLSANMSYFDANSRISVISTGTINVNFNGVGYFVGNALSTPVTAVTVSRGGIAVSSATIRGALTVVHDPAIWQDSTEGTRLRLPGL